MEHQLSSEGVLDAFLSGGLAVHTRREIVEHLSRCPECYERWEKAGGAARMRRRSARLLLACVVLALGATTFLLTTGVSTGTIRSLVQASSELTYRPIVPRLSGDFAYREPAGGTLRGNVVPEIVEATVKLEAAAEHQPTPANLHALGLSLILVGHLDQAIDVLGRAVQGDSANPAYRSDLAAAYLARATRDRNGADFAAACEELSKLVLIEKSPEPGVRFNLALAYEGLENRVAAERAWDDYLELDGSSRWADEARRHLAGLRETSSKPVADVTDALATDPEWVCDEPLRTRRYAETEILRRWAEATLHGDGAAASASLSVLSRSADALHRCTGDPCLLSVGAALRSASPAEARNAASGIFALRDAREHALREQGRAAGAAYERAAEALKSAGLSLHLLAARQAAFQYYYAGDSAAARRLLEDTPRDEAKAPGWTGQLYWVDGMIHLASGSPHRSLELYQRAVGLFTRIRDSRSVAAVEMLIAENLTSLGASHDAWPHRLNALSALRRNGDSEREQVALNEAAEAALSAGHPFGALAYQQSAQSLSRDGEDPSVVTYGELWLALINDRCGLRDAAVAALRRAGELAARVPGEDARRRVQSDIDFADGVISQSAAPHRSVALWSAALDYYRAAGSHYRAAQLLLSRGRLYRRLGQPEHARADLVAGVVELEAQRPLVADETLRTTFFGRAAELFNELISLHLERGDAAAAYDAAERRRERTLLDAFEENVHERPVTVDRIRETLQQNEVLLDYAVLPDGLVRWEVRRGGVKASRVAIRAFELRRLIDRVYSSRAPENITAPQKSALVSLRKALIPFDGTEQPEKNLIIVPDPLLVDVPFAALFDGTSFLIERYSLELSPSASLFVACRERERIATASAAPYRAVRFLVFGDTRAVPAMSLPELRGAAAELRDTAAALKTVPVTNGDATKQAFLRGAPEADIVYVAGHAVAGAVAKHPALVMAFDRSEGGDRLTIEEIRQSRLRGRLVVLAACSTAAHQGEGVTSLVRGFLVAGVPAVAGSLLSVDDRATQRLLAPFAREVAHGMPPVMALRHVQLAALGRDRAADPLSWAGFQIYGSASLPIQGDSRARGEE